MKGVKLKPRKFDEFCLIVSAIELQTLIDGLEQLTDENEKGDGNELLDGMINELEAVYRPASREGKTK